MGTLLVVPIIRIIVYWGLYWGPPILGNYRLGFRVFWSWPVDVDQLTAVLVLGCDLDVV